MLQNHVGVINSIWCHRCERWCHQRCSVLRNLRRAGDNFRCPTCVRGVVVMPQKSEVWKDSLEIMDSFRYLGDVISYGVGAETAVRNKISYAWSKWSELACLLVNYGIPLKERAKICCARVRPALLYAAESWALLEILEGLLASCEHRMLRYMSRVRWWDRITNEEVRRKWGLENLEHRLRKMRLKWFGRVKAIR